VLDRVDVQLHFGFAVLERIPRAFGPIREPPLFTQRHEADAKLVSNRRTKKKPTRVDADDFIDSLVAQLVQKNINRGAE
jgi:hypothetical protein